MSYSLASVEARHTAAPETFEIPPLSVRRNLRLGMLVKLIFEPGERMWVEIVDALPGQKYIGILRNNPAVVKLEYGARIDFGPEHVASIESPED